MISYSKGGFVTELLSIYSNKSCCIDELLKNYLVWLTYTKCSHDARLWNIDLGHCFLVSIFISYVYKFSIRLSIEFLKKNHPSKGIWLNLLRLKLIVLMNHFWGILLAVMLYGWKPVGVLCLIIMYIFILSSNTNLFCPEKRRVWKKSLIYLRKIIYIYIFICVSDVYIYWIYIYT